MIRKTCSLAQEHSGGRRRLRTNRYIDRASESWRVVTELERYPRAGNTSNVVARPLELNDQPDWRRLYGAYANFYEKSMSEEQLNLLWSRLWSQSGLECLVAEMDGRVVGLAHFRVFQRPLNGVNGGYLDDLFVDPAVRKGGVASELITEIKRLAKLRGWSVVRWITDEKNYAARGLYDSHAAKTAWVTYDMSPEYPNE